MSGPRPYPEYIDSGVEWLGGVPSHWRVAQLKRFAQVVNGGTPTPEPGNWGGDIAWATPVDLNAFDGRQVLQTIRTLTWAGLLNGSAGIPPGSVVVSTRAPIGYSAIATHTLAFNQGCKGLVPGEAILPSYLLYTMQAAKKELSLRGQGTTFPEISTQSLGSVPIPAPPKPEQAALVEFLDRETFEADAFIAEQEELIELLAERRNATTSHAVTRGLDAATPMKDSGIGWLGEVPAGWQVRPLWTLFTRVKDVGHPDETMLSVFRELGVVVKAEHENFNKTAENRDIYQLVEPGWLVTNRMKAWQGSVGISSHRGIVSGHYLCFAPTHSESPEYLNLLFRSIPYAAAYATLSRGVRIGQAEIDNDHYRVLPVLLPPVQQQLEIVEYVRKETSELDAAIADAREAIALSRERRAALISAAVTGKIDVRRHPEVAVPETSQPSQIRHSEVT